MKSESGLSRVRSEGLDQTALGDNALLSAFHEQRTGNQTSGSLWTDKRSKRFSPNFPTDDPEQSGFRIFTQTFASVNEMTMAL